jgi:RNA polymerase sigma-70 factor (ECF subfamily)
MQAESRLSHAPKIMAFADKNNPDKNETFSQSLRHTQYMQHEYDLVAQAKAGDMRSFQQLVELNSGRVFSAAYRILDNKELAEDCVQETFLRMFTKLHTFEFQAKFSTWLYSVAINTALDYRRKNARHQHQTDGDFDQIEASGMHSPEAAAVATSLGEMTQRAINQLNEDIKIAFVLRHFEGCTIEEITQILGVSTSSAKSKIFRAVARLREILGPQVGDYENVD